MKILITKDYEEMSLKGALLISQTIKDNPCAVLGLATGSTVIGTYGELVKMYKNGEISFKNVKTVNLDEYIGLGEESTQSYVTFMRENLFNLVDADLKNTHLPNGTSDNAEEECKRYSSLLCGLPRDIQLLGLGSNGHIGFNEPLTSFNSKTHVVELAESTVKDNSRLFANAEDVPRRAITMGISESMAAKRILMLVNGANKAKAVYNTVKGQISENCPASILQRHDDAVLVLDEAAASLL